MPVNFKIRKKALVLRILKPLLLTRRVFGQGAGKSAVLNSLIGHPVLVSLYLRCATDDLDVYSPLTKNFFFPQPTGENGATRAPISIELSRDSSVSSKSIILQIDSKNQQVSASKSWDCFLLPNWCWVLMSLKHASNVASASLDLSLIIVGFCIWVHDRCASAFSTGKAK
jgi:hypothetical protein